MLSIMCQTYGEEYAPRFLEPFRKLADELEAEFVINADLQFGEQAVEMAKRYADKIVGTENWTPEAGIPDTAAACSGDMILRLDADESISKAMWEWLVAREWQPGWIYSFPYAWLWGDDNHFITTPPFWTDPHARLMPKNNTMQWAVRPHAGNIFGLGKLVPVAHCHHKFLVQSVEHRVAHADKLDGLAPGFGSGEHYGKFMFPERHFKEFTVREVGDGHVQLYEWLNTGEKVKL